ncbi:MAG: hypothetical protein HYZ28_21300 [Myxococcales bacterium]|nr:hypothetical protein [Myxococcales bacterium]
MGQHLLPNLPRTRKWNEVVELIKSDAEVQAVAAAAFEAAHLGLEEAARDPALAKATWLLTQLPLAARAADYLARLRELGLTTREAPSVMELVGAFSDAVDAHLRGTGGRTDLGEMAQMAAAETLTASLAQRTQSLFGSTAADVKRELAALATPKQFGDLSRDFFANLTRRYLASFLGRELSNHVGAGRRFANLAEHTEFNAALDHHCQQAARIVQDFAGTWFSKTNFEGGITPEKAQGFVHVALKKLRTELRKHKGGAER